MEALNNPKIIFTVSVTISFIKKSISDNFEKVNGHGRGVSDEGPTTKNLLFFTFKKDLMPIELVWNDH